MLFVGCNKQNHHENNQFDLCWENWWNPESRFNWSGKLDVCYFQDESFCFLEDLKNWECKKWDHYYGDEEYYTEAFEDFDQNTDDEENNNEEIDNENSIKEEISECDDKWEDIVCWKDWNTYYNRCYLEFAWVEEETELAEVVNWQCIFW